MLGLQGARGGRTKHKSSSPGSKIGSSALNLHFISSTDGDLLGCVCGVITGLGGVEGGTEEVDAEGKEQQKEREKKEESCLSPKL